MTLDLKELRQCLEGLPEYMALSKPVCIELLDRLEEQSRQVVHFANRLMDPTQERAKLIEVLNAVRMSLTPSHHTPECVFGRVVDAVKACSEIK